jgi:hypothetical protein
MSGVGPTYVAAVSYAIAANIFVYGGIAFITGRLLPSLGVYTIIPGGVLRLILALLTFFFIANLCFGRLYTTVAPVHAGIISVSANVVVMVAATLLMEGRGPSVGLIAGAGLALLGAITVVGSR